MSTPEPQHRISLPLIYAAAYIVIVGGLLAVGRFLT